jgi:hypothetical protein
MSRRCGTWVLVVAALCLTGCAAAPVDDPLAVMLDRSRDPVRRLAAAEQLGPIDDASDPKAIAATFHNVLWSDSEPTALRLQALDRLIAYDADTFWLIAQRRIREVDSWDVLRPLTDRMVERGDPSFTATLVRSYVRKSQILTDDQRPERDAIVALNHGISLERAVWRLCVTESKDIKLPVRVDAWTLTVRLSGIERAKALLNKTHTQTLLIRDLKEADLLGVLPINREGILWLMHVRALEDGQYWETSRQIIHHQLHGSQPRGLELRHLSALRLIDEADMQLGKPGMLARVQSKLATAHVTQRSTAGVARHLPSESLADHAQVLCWADLLAIDRLLEALRDRSFTSELFRQAEADMADTRTEHGGVLAIKDGRMVALPFPANIRRHDQKFYSSEALIQRMYTGLFHYHFHAQAYRNADYAGPGVGDLKFVETLRPSAVVFTFLDRDTLGVDYYQPGGVVVDLGVIRR